MDATFCSWQSLGSYIIQTCGLESFRNNDGCIVPSTILNKICSYNTPSLKPLFKHFSCQVYEKFIVPAGNYFCKYTPLLLKHFLQLHICDKQSQSIEKYFLRNCTKIIEPEDYPADTTILSSIQTADSLDSIKENWIPQIVQDYPLLLTIAIIPLVLVGFASYTNISKQNHTDEQVSFVDHVDDAQELIGQNA